MILGVAQQQAQGRRGAARGADQVLLKLNPKIAKDPQIFPTKQMLANVHQYDPVAVNNVAYKEKFAQLTGS